MDLTVDVDEKRIIKAENACILGKRGFANMVKTVRQL
jgi:formylmethanofuran dehydrogenase subunit B